MTRTWRLDLAALTLLALAIGGMVWPLPIVQETLGEACRAFLGAWICYALLLLRRDRWLSWSCHLLGSLLAVPVVAYTYETLGHDGGLVGQYLLAQSIPPTPMIALAVVATTLLLGPPLIRLWRLLPKRVARPQPTTPARSVPAAALIPIHRPVAVPLPPPAPVNPPAVLPPAKAIPAATAVVSSPIPIVHHGLTPAPRDLSQLNNGATSERERFADYELPPLTLLEDPKPFSQMEMESILRDRAALVEQTCRDFGIRVVGISTGPVVTMYEVTLETGVRVNKITSLADDLALNLRVPSVRIVAPIPGKNAVGLELPNDQRADVRLKEVIQTAGGAIANYKIPIFLGKDASGMPLVRDLADMPHLLIAGTTGTGKSVCLNTIILSLLMTRRPDETKLVLIDPKGGVEMECYSRVPHLMSPIIADMKKAEAVLAWAVDKMEERYDLLRRARVRSIAGYNDLTREELHRRIGAQEEEEKQRIPDRLSYIVIVIDEMADLMMQMKREVEGHVIRLAQKSRAAGIHLILATQKPTVDVVTGLIKSNLPSRICFKVAQKSDSRVVLDVMGADKLLGRGDMLFLPPGTSDLIRAQGAFASEAEIGRVTDYLDSEPCYEAELLQLKTKEAREAEEEGGSLKERLKARDALYEQAVEVVINSGRGSVSLLQRSLGIGYGRAARLIDFMAEDGIVGDYQGSNARAVNYTPEQWAQVRAS
jgi:S-DNA-T family DNA segregation ATPase FtsK/SpoIIIE